mmetsp:Transcript_43253/g.89152  ORF Transcript_43253/g.89152 Transcript_43253/m.89152 type:complete len:204 (+) Transcript_43253:377-988(+)
MRGSCLAVAEAPFAGLTPLEAPASRLRQTLPGTVLDGLGRVAVATGKLVAAVDVAQHPLPTFWAHLLLLHFLLVHVWKQEIQHLSHGPLAAFGLFRAALGPVAKVLGQIHQVETQRVQRATQCPHSMLSQGIERRQRALAARNLSGLVKLFQKQDRLPGAQVLFPTEPTAFCFLLVLAGPRERRPISWTCAARQRQLRCAVVS